MSSPTGGGSESMRGGREMRIPTSPFGARVAGSLRGNEQFVELGGLGVPQRSQGLGGIINAYRTGQGMPPLRGGAGSMIGVADAMRSPAFQTFLAAMRRPGAGPNSGLPSRGPAKGS